MQRMSRAQRILVIYLLMKLQEPRIIKRIIRNYGGGIGKHGNDMHTSAYSTATSIADLATKDHDLLDGLADDDHTQYLLHDGTRAMTGDLDMGTQNIKNLGYFEGHFKPVGANQYVGTSSKVWEGGYIRKIYATTWNTIATPASIIVYPTATGTLNFLGGVANSVVARVYGASFEVPLAGDITMLDDKFIDLGNDTSGAAANAANRGKLRFVEGAGGARDRVYSCMKSDADAYSWVEIANGGA